LTYNTDYEDKIKELEDEIAELNRQLNEITVDYNILQDAYKASAKHFGRTLKYYRDQLSGKGQKTIADFTEFD
jgi:DNA gyrase/topoisomerase IV subunit A